jgi:hypothetical protein
MATLDGTDVVYAGGVTGQADVFGIASFSLAVIVREAAEPKVVDVTSRP